jgi:hypothetical protein
MKSRRRIAFPKANDRVMSACDRADQSMKLRPAE